MIIKLNFVLLIVFFTFTATDLFSQGKKPLKSGMDTIHVVGQSIIFINDSAIYIQNDTILYLPDSVSIQYKRGKEPDESGLYDTLKEKLSRNRITDKIQDFLIRDNPKKKHKPTPAEENRKVARQYRKSAGKTIGEIHIKQLEPFGTTISDTSVQVDKWHINAANKLHLLTWQKVIYNNLLFKRGDQVDPLTIADSERFLRTLPFIKDARIYLKPSAISKEVVDVLVVTKDVWSITGSLEVSRLNAMDVNVRERNLLGTGHELNNTITFDTRENPVFGYIGNYRIPNIKRSFTVGEFNFAYSEPVQLWEINLYRNFITPDILNAGGFKIGNKRIFHENPLTDTSRIQFPIHYSQQDFWFGRAFEYRADTVGRPKIVFSGRFLRYNFTDRPEVRLDTNRLYTNRVMLLGAVSLTKRQYSTNNLIFGYGITEDIPSGHLLTLTFGKEFNEFNNRTYLGLDFSKGNFIGKLGYLRGNLAFGGYINKRNFEQGLMQTKFNYFSHLLRIKKYYLRQFINIDYQLGIGRLQQERISLGTENGIRGFRNRELLGTKKITISTETALFTPYYLFGFRFAVFAFADLGMVTNNQSFFGAKLYQGYGIGFRVRNENLTFNTFQIRIGIYPVTLPGSSFLKFDFASRPRLYLEDFAPSQPRTLDFYYLE